MANSFNKMIDEKVIKRGKQACLYVLMIFISKRVLIVVLTMNVIVKLMKLYQYMLTGGKIPNLEVVPRDEGGVWVVEGHRRTLTYHRLRDEAGKPVEWIK